MSKDFPFDPNEQCDNCGAKGAYDLYGDYVCHNCLHEAPEVHTYSEPGVKDLTDE